MNYNYSNDSYNLLKKDIDAIISNSSAAEFERKKGSVLAAFTPYVEYLCKATKKSQEEVREVLLELEQDKEFFNQISSGLQDIVEQCRRGLDTGELRVHAYTVYAIVRLLKPDIMVETGVATGKSSLFALKAMDKNQKGKLFSIDLPIYEGQKEILQDGAWISKGKEVGWLVPDFLRSRWELRLGDARELLPILRKELPVIDIFQHDSLHTYEHMHFEMDLAKTWVKPGGIITVDDIQTNNAFAEQAQKLNSAAFGTFGVLWN